MRCVLTFCVALTVSGLVVAGDGNRLSYLDSNEVWFPHKDFPKLITPQWVGEDGVECVVTLAIDDMRDPAKYEAYLRPILQRLKQIDGRAPVSIMTNSVKPDDPQLQTWLQEGLSIECHTADHPCPILAGGDIKKAKSTYDRCVDLIGTIPNNKPVAFRTPCCDSLNTVSPRLFSEIITKKTPGGNFLQLDSSVFTLYTADDPTIPRGLLYDPDGKEKFRKYIPRGFNYGGVTHSGFVNLVENYPYPYVVQRGCWEFPCMVPSDWSAQHLHKPNNPDTVRDWKSALDITVLKQGVFNLVFHPHNWIKPEQVIELIDHAVAKHGKKVKFLTFKECVERLNANLKLRDGIAEMKGKAADVCLLDNDGDGYMDVIHRFSTSVWKSQWDEGSRSWKHDPVPGILADAFFGLLPDVRFGVLDPSGAPSALTLVSLHEEPFATLQFEGRNPRFPGSVPSIHVPPLNLKKSNWSIRDVAFRFLDIDRDGRCEYLVGADVDFKAWRLGENSKWEKLPFVLPGGLEQARQNKDGAGDPGLRFVDLNGDGKLDVMFSNHERFGAWLFESMEKGWCIELLNVKRGEGKVDLELPPIVREDGSDNGFFVRDQHLCWINEDTSGLPDFIMRVAFDKLLGDRMPDAKSPEAAKQSMRVTPGYQVELVAHEPLTMDPVALDFGPDRKLWIAEMADYPRGLDGNGQPGGRIRYLEDTDSDGLYDKSTLFMEGVPFPNGVISWKRGVLVSAAPDIFYAEDTDGDGKADVKKVLFTGFAEGNQQHRANGFVRGLDNWLYMANGDSGGVITCVESLNEALAGSDSPHPNSLPAKPGRGDKAKIDIRGRDIRIRPDTGEIEAISGQTQFGRNRDDCGNWFGNNNSRPMWHYVLDDHYLRRNPHLVAPNGQKDVSVVPGAAPVFPVSKTLTRFNDFHTANRFTSACSSMVYRDVGFGLVPSPPTSGERARVTAPSGEQTPDRENASSKSSEQNRKPGSTLSPPHPNPFSTEAGGEGARESYVFISEPVHNLVHREVMQPDGISFTSKRTVGEEQSEFLSSTDNWFRPTQLKTGPDGALYIADMYRLVIEHPEWIPIAWQRKLDLRAGHDKGRIWRVAPIGAKRRPIPNLQQQTTAELVASLRHSNGWHRDLAQQLLIDRADPTAIPLLQKIVLAHQFPPRLDNDAIVANTEPAVVETLALARMHALCTLDGLKDGLSVPAIVAGLSDPHPGVRRHAIRLSAKSDLPKEGLVEHLVALVDDVDPQVRMQLAYTFGEIKNTRADAALGQLAAKASGHPWMMAAVMSSLRSDNLSAVMSEAIAAAPDDTGLLNQLLTQATAFKNDEAVIALLSKVTVPSPEGDYARWQLIAMEQFSLALERRDDKFNPFAKVPEGLTLIKRVEAMSAAVKKLAMNNDASLADREVAVRLLVLDSEADFQLGLLVPQQPPALQSAAITALGRMKRPDVAKSLISAYRTLAPGLRAEAASVLLSRDGWRDELLAALEAKRLMTTDLDAASRQRLLDHKSKEVRERAAKLLAVDLNTDRAKLVAQYLPMVRAGGDVQHGRQLFTRRCAQCHKLGNEGHSVGPDLVSLTDKSHEALLTAILDPNRAVEAKFLTFAAVTKSGVTHIGLITNESATSLTLRAAEAKETALLRNELDELQSTTKSLMPEGLEKEVSPSDAASLIAYIRNNVPLPARKQFPGNDPNIVKPDAEGSFTLSPFTAEIYGPTIVIEEKHKNFGWWSSVEDHVIWTIQVPKPGRYSVSWSYACESSAAGETCVVEAAGKSIRHKVTATSGWDDYQTTTLGEIELPAGEVRLTVKPASRPLPAMVDLKQLTLRLLP